MNSPNLRIFSEIRLLHKVMGILFWFDSRGFVDAKHYSKGLFGACANFGAEIRIFIAQKGLWGPAI